MPKAIFEIRKVIGGMIRDLVKRDVPKTKYYNAENINLTPNGNDKTGGASVALGSTFAVDLGVMDAPADDYEAWMINLDLTTGSIGHVFTYNNGALFTSSSLSSAAGTAADRYTSLVTQIEGAFLGAGLTATVYIPPAVIAAQVVQVGFKVEGYTATLSETISGVEQDIIIIKEYYGDDDGAFIPLKSIYIDTDLYIISTNGTIIRLGVAQKNYVTGAWTYTVVLQTNQIQIPTTQVIDMDGQIDFGERVSIYFTTNGIPRCFYVKRQTTWVANSAMIYYDSITPNPDGYYTYNGINAEMGLQVLENFARVELNSVIDSGGSLTTGNKQYFIRQMSGDEVKSGVGIGSNLVSIYTFPQTNTRLYGQLGGEQTTKAVSLNILGLNPDVYDKFELIEVDNVDGVLTGWIVNSYDITDNEMTILHTGSENYVSLDLAELATQQVLIKNAQNLVIARNRLFISNIETQADYDLSAWAQTIVPTTAKVAIPAIGLTYSSVAEYQLPQTIFEKTGYMINENYRFGIILYFKNGFVSSPYFISDYTILADVIGTNLTDGGTTTPTEVYVFYPEFAVDLTAGNPTVDGIALKDAIYGYSIVRCECIPEVLACGYIMPAVTNTPSADNYTTGANLVTLSAYTEISTSTKRLQTSFMSPDILFGQTNIQPLAGDIIFNYGQTEVYNSVIQSIPGDNSVLRELSHNGTTATPYQVGVVLGENVPFNQDGVVDILGRKLRNLVIATFGGVVANVFGNNQKSIALELDDYINPINGVTDYGFYYAQYIRYLTNKYGDVNIGNYISCGHFRAVSADTSYVDEVFGGDTFTQKNFIKHCNYYSSEPSNPSAAILRLGLSYYTQNRGNYQLRYFTEGNDDNYPYTTTSLLEWQSLANQLDSGQLNYTIGYSPLQPITSARSGYNPNAEIDSVETNIVYYSDIKVNDSLADPYRIFLPINRKAYPAKYGDITNMFLKDVNYLVIMMNEQILSQQINQQQVVVDGTATILGDGSVMGAMEQPISNIGSPIKTGAAQYKNSRGQIHIVWYSPYYKKLLRYTGNSINDIGDETNNQSFLTDNNQYILENRDIRVGYDFVNDDVLVTASHEISGSTEYSSLSTYSAGNIVWIDNGINQKQYYIAKIAVPVSTSPNVIANRVQYWDRYLNSNYTLVFNDKLGQVSCFFTDLPIQYFTFNDNLLVHTFADNSSYLWETNKGLERYGFGSIVSSLTFIFNDLADFYKTFRTAYFDISEKPLYVMVKTENSVTYTNLADINFSRPHWGANVYNDATISGSNTGGLNTLKTSQIEGQYCEVTVWFDSSDAANVNNIKESIMKMIPRPKFFNR